MRFYIFQENISFISRYVSPKLNIRRLAFINAFGFTRLFILISVPVMRVVFYISISLIALFLPVRVDTRVA